MHSIANQHSNEADLHGQIASGLGQAGLDKSAGDHKQIATEHSLAAGHYRAAAQAYFAQGQWDLDEVELLFLERFAEKQPGQFPPALGEAYPPRGEAMLLAPPAILIGSELTIPLRLRNFEKPRLKRLSKHQTIAASQVYFSRGASK